MYGRCLCIVEGIILVEVVLFLKVMAFSVWIFLWWRRGEVRSVDELIFDVCFFVV